MKAVWLSLALVCAVQSAASAAWIYNEQTGKSEWFRFNGTLQKPAAAPVCRIPVSCPASVAGETIQRQCSSSDTTATFTTRSTASDQVRFSITGNPPVSRLTIPQTIWSRIANNDVNINDTLIMYGGSNAYTFKVTDYTRNAAGNIDSIKMFWASREQGLIFS